MARILIADDEPMICNTLSTIFHWMGHEVGIASNGSEALRLFDKNPFDLVTTDLNMPVMDGYILAKRIKQKSPHTPVIMITSSEIEVESERITKRGYVDLVLYKPLTFEILEKATGKLLCSDPSKQKQETCNGVGGK